MTVGRFTVEYRLAGRTYRMTVGAESPHHACRKVALRTGGTQCRAIGRAL